jgi:hypothetical protein
MLQGWNDLLKGYKVGTLYVLKSGNVVFPPPIIKNYSHF